MVYKSLIPRILFILSLMLVTISVQAEVSASSGKTLFKNNCASCHNKNMKDDLTGPALGGVQERWEGREELLYSWIRNSQAVIASGDEYAVNLYNKWNKALMNPFTNLTDDEVGSLLLYINNMYSAGCAEPPCEDAVPGGPAIAAEQTNNTPLYLTLMVILGILAVVLARIVSNLNHMVQTKEGNAPAQRATLVDMLTSKGMIAFVLFALVIFGGYTTVNNAINLNRMQGYAPDQPIKFSHATHAGLQQIDCQYCHDGARRSKHSVIPAANTCMNCHKAIKKGSQYGTAEITKIYASVGYDPATDKMIENYEDMDIDAIKKVYTDWIESNYRKDNSIEEGTALPKDGVEEVAAQWDGIVSSLTTDVKDHVSGPIPWVRIHNLPDHVYFNHAQHVTVGKQECQTCHGPVEEMELLYQYSPLSMGWCINCHRQTEVQFSGNEYYESYEMYHNQIKDGKREKVTVEEIGGLECQKCHY